MFYPLSSKEPVRLQCAIKTFIEQPRGKKEREKIFFHEQSHTELDSYSPSKPSK